MFFYFIGLISAIMSFVICFRVPWFQYPIIYDIRAKPRKITSPTGSKGTFFYAIVKVVDIFWIYGQNFQLFFCVWVLKHWTFWVVINFRIFFSMGWVMKIRGAPSFPDNFYWNSLDGRYNTIILGHLCHWLIAMGLCSSCPSFSRTNESYVYKIQYVSTIGERDIKFPILWDRYSCARAWPCYM